MALVYYEVGKIVPSELLTELNKAHGERAFCSLGKNGIDIFIIIDNISKKELKEFKGSLSIIYQEYQIPFLIIKYKGMSYDMPLTLNEQLGGNATNIYIIDLKGYILKHMRRLGLDEKLYTAIKEGVEFVKDIDKNTFWNIIQNNIYPKYSASDMCKGGVRQRFER